MVLQIHFSRSIKLRQPILESPTTPPSGRIGFDFSPPGGDNRRILITAAGRT
jgi:hypothetical protein